MGISWPSWRLLSSKSRRIVGWSVLVGACSVVVVPMIIFANTGTACGGGYPDTWCRAERASVVDTWGMYNRECVSYTAYRVAQSGRTMPYGFGDANKWPDAARARGIAVDTNPKAGDVAIKPEGQYGHSMYVEAVEDNGKVRISQYNAQKTGNYTEMTIDSSGLIFIHF